MTLHISSVFTYDEDAGNYIQAVETADGQALESATRKAINNFVIGCKQDGIWDAIKASCILSGARTLTGALVPLVGTAPTNYNFVAGDYDRKTGLVGDGSMKHLDSNRNNNADPQNSKHVSVYVSTVGSFGFMGSGSGLTSGVTQLYNSTGTFYARNNEYDPVAAANIGPSTAGLFGTSRNSSVSYAAIRNRAISVVSRASVAPNNANILLYNLPTLTYFTGARLAFYSIGEALDLAKLDGRVTDLITAFGAAIP